MRVDVPTPPDGLEALTAKRSRNGRAVAFVIPLTAIGAGVVVALGWAWRVDKGQALIEQRLEEHERFIRRFENKLDDLRDLLVHRNLTTKE